MPGTPSGKGCDACRKQKKKCDQLKPACTRCTRLQIVCIGAGVQRYKFLEEDGITTPSSKRVVVRSRRTTPISRESCSSHSLLRTPSSEDALLSSALIAKLKAKDDLRYHLSWTYGGFLEDVPKRVGSNEALDTAVNALVFAHSRFGLGQSFGDPDSLSKYVHAVGTLRVCLDDPLKAREANTLCAVMLLLICQSFVGATIDQWSSHTEGAAIILKARGYYDPEDEFERMLILTLRGPVLFEGLFNPRIRFSREEWRVLVESRLDVATSGPLMCSLAHVPSLMESATLALLHGMDFDDLIAETSSHYHKLKPILAELQQAYDGAQKPRSKTTMRIHAQSQRMFGLGLAIVLIFNCLLRALDPADTELEKDAWAYCERVVELADQAAVYRPLGSAYFSMCLIAAWAASENEHMRFMLRKSLVDYRSDFPGVQAGSLDLELDYIYQRLFLLKY